MFGWNKPSEEPRNSGSKKSGSFGLDIGIDHFDDDFELPPEADILTEEDLTDPNLLRELQALSAGNPKPKPTTKPAPKPKPKPPKPVAIVPEIDIDALSALGVPNDDDDMEVELNEEDMKDPTLLGELRELGYQSDGDKDGVNIKQQKSESKVESKVQSVSIVTDNNKTMLHSLAQYDQSVSIMNDSDKSISYSLAQQKNDLLTIDQPVSTVTDGDKDVSRSQVQSKHDHDPLTADSPLDVKLLEEDVAVLAKYTQEEKLKAFTKKRAGDKAGAVEAMKAYKQLEARRDKILASKSAISSETSQANIQSNSSSASKLTENAQSHKANSPRNPELIMAIKQRQEQYMAAVNVFKNTNYQRAKEYMAIAKNLQTAMQSLLNDSQLPEGWVLPREPDMSEKTQSSSSPTPKKKVAGNITSTSTPKQKVLTAIDATKSRISIEDEKPLTMMSREDQYARLLTQLESQISLCTTISAYYLKSGDKSQASFFYKYKKTFVADLESLTSYQKHGKDVPPFHHKEVTYNVENAFFDLSTNDLEVCIEKAWNLGNKEVNGKDVEAYVSFDIGWPPEGSPGAGSGKGDTSVARRSMDPEFNWKKTLSIERNKAFQRHIDRKKASFEVFHYRGFFRKAISLGKALVKLDSLVNKSEIHEVIELVDSNRRPTGGKLEIRLRVRTPLLKADVISKTERWLIIDDSNANHPLQRPLASSSTATPSKSVPTSTPPRKTPINLDKSEDLTPIVQKISTGESSEVLSQMPTPTAQKLPTPRIPSATPTKNAQPEAEQSELEQAEEQLNNVDLIVSSKLLQQESEIIDAEISKLESQQKPVPDDLLDRKSAIQIKMNLMEIQVQTGQLTIDKYIEQVKVSIAGCKKLALIFKKAGNLELAKKALARSKIMEGEVKEIEEAMAGGAMNNE